MDITESGITVTTYSPPAGFDPRTATNTELVRAGFPRRPDDPQHLAHWNRILEELNGELNYTTPAFGPVRRRREPRLQRAFPAGTQGAFLNDHWSGALVFAPAQWSFCWLKADWTVPTITAPDPTQSYTVESWIGFDGEHTDSELCQIGIEQAIVVDGDSVTTQCYAWYGWWTEATPYAVPISNFGVSPGDNVTLVLCTAGAGSTKATASYTNTTTKQVTSLTFTAPQGTTLLGHCAEWIVERPMLNNEYALLPDYDRVIFSGCTAGTGDSTTVDGGSGALIDMTDGNNTVISAAEAVTSTVIECQYTGPTVA